MKGLIKINALLLLAFLIAANGYAGQVMAGRKIVVDINGQGDFTSIQAALNSLPETAAGPRLIFIKKGIYREKIYLEKSFVVLEGEDREATVITQAIARDQWRCLHNEDWGVATLNIDANDICLQNITVVNSYGFDVKKDSTVNCPLDTINHRKTISNAGHQMALRTMNATRIKAINCHFVAYAGDTVSPWNTEEGMFYFKDCTMEGGVDFYCPRGWAYAENCQFKAHTGVASIWHDGSKNPDAKTVLKGCSFSGFNGFKLGRYHKDAQFYLIDCSFDATMANEDIYLVASANNLRWGRRIYYFNCHRAGTDYAWYKDNLASAAGAPAAAAINAAWVFGNRWNPVEKNDL